MARFAMRHNTTNSVLVAFATIALTSTITFADDRGRGRDHAARSERSASTGAPAPSHAEQAPPRPATAVRWPAAGRTAALRTSLLLRQAGIRQAVLREAVLREPVLQQAVLPASVCLPSALAAGIWHLRRLPVRLHLRLSGARAGLRLRCASRTGRRRAGLELLRRGEPGIHAW